MICTAPWPPSPVANSEPVCFVTTSFPAHKAALLTESLDYMQHASSQILAALEPKQKEATSDCQESQLAEAC